MVEWGAPATTIPSLHPFTQEEDGWEDAPLPPPARPGPPPLPPPAADAPAAHVVAAAAAARAGGYNFMGFSYDLLLNQGVFVGIGENGHR